MIFANRYIQAYYLYQTGRTPTQSWVRAFDATNLWWPIVLQHLLLGMNAHINLDLGIAAAETVSPEELPNLKNDFEKINQVLASLVGGVQAELAEIWPILGFFNRNLGNVETAIINFSMEKARNAAWSFANKLSPLSGEHRLQVIKYKDDEMALFSRVVSHPGLYGSLILAAIRLGESGSIKQNIETLE